MERDERDEHDGEVVRCPSYGAVMYELEVECREVVCGDCDHRLERHLRAWLDFAAIRDE